MKRLALLVSVSVLAVAAAPAAGQSPGPLRWPGAEGKLGDERPRTSGPSRASAIRTASTRSAWSRPPPPHDRDAALLHRGQRAGELPRPALKLGRGGHPWLQIRLPRRPNGSKGWVPRAAFGRLRVLRTALEIDKRRLKARLFKDGKEIWTASVGIGAPSTPTPNGRYWVRERLPNFGGNAAYGPLAFGTAAYSRSRSGRAAASSASTARTSPA